MLRLILKCFDRPQDYAEIHRAMQNFTRARTATSEDELWILEHTPVLTQGLAGSPEHLIDAHGIPLISSDRGGQITYHGPGQLIAYTLFDLKRLNRNTREFVVSLERIVITLLQRRYGVIATGDRKAPGVYVNNAKIASIGLRVKHHCAYHGLALNVDLDLTPFSYINPCGKPGQMMTKISDFSPLEPKNALKTALIECFLEEFGYTVTHD